MLMRTFTILAGCLFAITLMSGCAGSAKQAQTMPQVTPAAQSVPQKEPFSLPEIKPKESAPAEAAASAKGAKDAPSLDAKKGLEAVILGADDDQYIILNFENTDIKTIISTFAELLQINYILTPGVSGTVTIQSYKRFPVKNLFAIFQTILETNNLTAIEEEGFYRIMPVDMAKTYALGIRSGSDVDFVMDSTFVTQLIPLENVKAADVDKILRTILPRGTNMMVYEPSNLLIVTARPQMMNKFLNIIDAIDVNEVDSNRVQTFVYYVENGEAKKLESLMKSVYLNDKSSPSTQANQAAQTAQAQQVNRRTRRPEPATQEPTIVEDSLPADLGDITITSYEDINALIIKASPRGYLSLLEVLRKVDVPPRQVLIDAMIAEITLTDEISYGLEWLIKSNNGIVGYADKIKATTPGTLPAHPGGLAILAAGVSGSDPYSAVFSALGSMTDINVLASPNILATDNKEAEIKIGNEVPTATGRTTTTGGTSDISIQYKTVGTILNVTPHITEKGKVSMKITIESSDIFPDGQVVGGQAYPMFSTRKATTSAVVSSESTLFLGGLIYDKKNRVKKGVPFLSRIPVIGALFGYHSNSISRTELILMVTPHVVTSEEEADILTRDYQDRVMKIKERLIDIQDERYKEKSPSGLNDDEKPSANSSSSTGGVEKAPAPEAKTPAAGSKGLSPVLIK